MTRLLEQGDAINPLQTQLRNKVDCEEHSHYVHAPRHWYMVLHNGCWERHLTHNSPLNFDLTVGCSLYGVSNHKVGSKFRVEP